MYSEWTLIDSETDRLKQCQAYNQKDAIRKSISWNIIPRKTDDVRLRIPRNTSDNTIMGSEEFDQFMDQISK